MTRDRECSPDTLPWNKSKPTSPSQVPANPGSSLWSTDHTAPSPCGPGRRPAPPHHPRLSLSESRSRHLCCLCKQPPSSCPAAAFHQLPCLLPHASILPALSAFPPGSEKGESSTFPGRPSSPLAPHPSLLRADPAAHAFTSYHVSPVFCLPLALCLRETQQLSFPSEGENKSLGVCHANRLRASVPFCSSARHQAPQQCGRQLPLLPHPTRSWHFGLGSALLRAQHRSLQGHTCSCHCFQRPTRCPPAFCSVRPCGQLPPPFDSSSLDLQDISPPLPLPTANPHLFVLLRYRQVHPKVQPNCSQ